MWTPLMTVALLTACLATFMHTVFAVDSSAEGADVFEGDLPSNKTEDDYDEYGELITPPQDGDSLPGTELDPNIEADTTPHSLPAVTEVSKGKKIPDIGDGEDCGQPPAVKHARIERGRKPRYSAGDAVSYSCEFGYVTDAVERTAHCFLSQDALEWTRPQINCIPTSCGDPGFVSNGHRVGSLFTFPNRVSFECDEGYELRGNGVRYCKTSGTWSGSLPTCEKIFCDPPPNPENGKVSFTSLEFGSELRYECEKGFLLKNRQTRFCSENGTWSGDDPVCQEAQCEPPVAPEHGSVQVVGGKSNVDSVAIYTCSGGRILSGSSTSKCLDIGQWTFPTPKCLEPCSVPKVPHGRIGKYEKHYRRMRYKELAEGAQVEDGSDLYLSCVEKYEPFGTTNIEEKIVCSLGEWDRYPRCDPASCRTSPPYTANVRDVKFDGHHGGGVVYYCKDDFKKAKYGNVKCEFGTWKGSTPTCQDTRCNTESVAITGFKKEQRLYKSKESYTPTCDKGYTAVTPINKLTCSDGKWTGKVRACVPANCTDDPPAIANGGILNIFSRLHSSEVTYACDELYHLKQSASKVRCSFGEWIGTPPTCQDTRCDVKDLKKREGVLADAGQITYNGDRLDVRCAGGFTVTGMRPKCVDGNWEERQPPCKENDCGVFNINKGRLTEKIVKEKCNFWGRNCVYWDEFIQVGRQRTFPAGSFVHVTCDQGHTLHGKGGNNVRVKCTRGQWHPRPVCVRTGMPYHEEEEATPSPPKSHMVAATQAARPPTARPVTTTRRPQPPPSEVEDASKMVGRNANNCSCNYHNADVNLVAYAGTEKLQSRAIIKDGCRVVFHCLPMGYNRLSGPKDITCRDCRTWHSSEYPQCVPPQIGDPVLMPESNGVLSELPGGALGVTPGSYVRMTCVANGVPSVPEWKSIPSLENTVAYADEASYTVYLDVKDIGPDQNGIYECAVQKHRSIAINIQVITSLPITAVSCPVFGDDDYFSVHYDKGQAVNSSAVFACKNPDERVVGPNLLTCLTNGQWSGDPPQCVKVCPEHQETEGMHISYNNGQNVGSTATFHCFLPRMRKGVSFTTCKSNGKWANPMPTCDLPTCNLNDLYEVFPEFVIPFEEDLQGDTVPFNSTVRLTCAEDRRLLGPSDRAKCGLEGRWEVPKVQCVIGCPPLDKGEGSEMLIDPEEEFYRIGQFVTFSCGPGHTLSSEVVRVMCLNGGWSASEIPRCVAVSDDEEDDDGTTKSAKRR